MSSWPWAICRSLLAPVASVKGSSTTPAIRRPAMANGTGAAVCVRSEQGGRAAAEPHSSAQGPPVVRLGLDQGFGGDHRGIKIRARLIVRQGDVARRDAHDDGR